MNSRRNPSCKSMKSVSARYQQRVMKDEDNEIDLSVSRVASRQTRSASIISREVTRSVVVWDTKQEYAQLGC